MTSHNPHRIKTHQKERQWSSWPVKRSPNFMMAVQKSNSPPVKNILKKKRHVKSVEKTTYHPEVFVEILRSPAQLQWRHASFRRSSFGLTRLNHPCRAYGNPATVSLGWIFGGETRLEGTKSDSETLLDSETWIQKLSSWDSETFSSDSETIS